MLSLDEILAKAEQITLETQLDSITPARVGELFASLAEQLRLGVGGGVSIGASKLSELSDVMLLNNKDNDILQKIGTKWTNIQLDVNKINQIANFWKVDELGNLYTDLNLYSKSGVAAYGAGPDGEGGATAYDRLDAWSVYTAEKSGWVLSAFLGNDLNARVSALEAGGTGGSSVAFGTASGGYIPLTVDGVTNSLALNTHQHTVSQITNFPTALPASDVFAWAKTATKPGYTWSEIGSKPMFFNPATHTHVKADITDFPTSMPASDVYAWAKAATKPTYAIAEITGLTDALTGLNVLLTWFKLDELGNLYTDLNLYSKGGLSAYGTGTDGGGATAYDRLDLWSDYVAGKSGWVLSAFLGNDLNTRVIALEAGGTGGSTVAFGTASGGYIPLTVDGVSNSLALNTHQHTVSQITNFPTALPASDVFAWAKAATKPSYTFSEIGSKPTTLSGYGITDALLSTAYTASDVLTKIKTVDGSGSGLDADLLDGFHAGGASGAWWSKIPVVGADGVMEVGKYFDFHETNEATTDYDGRISSELGVVKWNGYTMYHAGNSNKSNVNWTANTLIATTDVTISSLASTDKSVKTFINKFNSMFDIDAQGIIYAKTDFYSVGGVSSHGLGTPAGPILNADMNANTKNINNANLIAAIRVNGNNAILGQNIGSCGVNKYGLFAGSGDETIATYDEDSGLYEYANNMFNIDYQGTAKANAFKFGNYTFKQDASGRLGIYNGTTEIACFNTDGTYVNL